MEKYTLLRERHDSFYYHSYTISPGKLSFHFSMGGHHFRPVWTFDEKLCGDLDDPVLCRAVFSLGMAELVSYWKCACPPNVVVECGELDQWQIQWWKKLYRGGLGEFFYRNGITPGDDFMEICPVNMGAPELIPSRKSFDGCLIPVGGGKDSIVTMELLKRTSEKLSCYIINPRGATLGTAYAAGFSDGDIVKVKRTIDPELIALNAQGYLNGHTPFSAVIAFSSWIFAYLSGKRYITLSNESSANEGNLSGSEVNHQYSKSTEFERDFRAYAGRCFGEAPEYFSLLRPWSEWQIAREFTAFPKYLPVFQSCNVGSKTDTWCGKCAKCLYVYIMLAAFLDDERLIPVFGRNMLDSAEFTGLFEGLAYPDTEKPFECVGTREEINLALQTAARRRERLPLLLERYMSGKPAAAASLDSFFDEENFVPERFIGLLRD